MKLYSANLARASKPADVFVHFFAKEPNAFWLDREINQDNPYSVMGSGSPIETSLTALSEYFDESLESGIETLPFDWRPGLVGLIEYEGNARFLKVDRALVVDHRLRRLYAVGLFQTESDFETWCHAILLRLALVGGEAEAYAHASGQGKIDSISLRHDSQSYLKLIEQAQTEIARGEVYQLCLTNQIEMQLSHDALNLFLSLRKSNSAPYAAFLRIGNTSVVCNSPEQFIKVSAAGALSTKPIKGTRPRGATDELDRAAADELKNNAKERAENLMIVDLMRNDLGKVAIADSMRVAKLFEIESYATVHQLVSTVEAQLADDKHSIDAVEAAFPGGSMTGAPKHRAMEIIRELEAGKRGVYSGAIGSIGFDGSVDLGMTIRTIVLDGSVACIGVGGGITIDSDPQAELAETKLKAMALLRALNAPDPWA